MQTAGLKSRVSASALAAMIIWQSPAHAAQSATPTTERVSGEPTASEVDGEEIVVTATRRIERLDETPLSVTAVTSERLEELNVTRFDDYFRTVPGLTSVVRADGKLDFAIRGINATVSSIPNTSATVGQYIDETPITATDNQVDFRLFDVERVEVLRGPQGTYYGEGSMGGTIRVITRKPDASRFRASVGGRLSVTEDGGLNHIEEAMVNAPLVEDRLALRVNGFYAKDAGFVDNVRGDENINDARNWGVRGALRFTPSDDLTVDAQVIHTEGRSNGIATYEPELGDLLVDRPLTSDRQRDEGTIGSLTVEKDFGWASLVSATSLSRRETLALFDNSETGQFFSMPGAQQTVASTTDAVTQELRLASSLDWSERWSYIVGAFYLDRNRDTTLDVVGNISLPFQAPSLGQVTATLDESDQRQIALFGELGFAFTPKLRATIGVRNTWVKSSYAGEGVAFGQPQLPTAFEQRDSVQTGKFGLSYQATPQFLAYSNISRGFRTGGLNPSLEPDPAYPRFFDPDFTWNYEVGFRATTPSRSFTVNGVAYYINWSDIQVQDFVENGNRSIAYFTNGGDASVRGAELEVVYRPMPNWNVTGSAAYTDAQLDEDQPAPPPSGGPFAPPPTEFPGQKGDPIPYVPKFTASLSNSYSFALPDTDWKGFVQGNIQYYGSVRTEFGTRRADGVVNSRFFKLDPQYRAGLQLGVEREDARIALFVDNLLDDRAELNAFTQRTIATSRTYVLTNQPRTAGVQVRLNF